MLPGGREDYITEWSSCPVDARLGLGYLTNFVGDSSPWSAEQAPFSHRYLMKTAVAVCWRKHCFTAAIGSSIFK